MYSQPPQVHTTYHTNHEPSQAPVSTAHQVNQEYQQEASEAQDEQPSFFCNTLTHKPIPPTVSQRSYMIMDLEEEEEEQRGTTHAHTPGQHELDAKQCR